MEPPYTCDYCDTPYRYAIAAAMCCDPTNDIDDE
jgi:hypothetical protein